MYFPLKILGIMLGLLDVSKYGSMGTKAVNWGAIHRFKVLLEKRHNYFSV